MDQNSQVEILEGQIRECFGRVVWTHKTHEKCSDILLKRDNYFKISQIILSAIITTGILVAVFGDIKWVGIITALISTSLLALNTYLKKYNLGEVAQKHTDCAADLWDIREKYLSLLTEIKARAIGVNAIIEKRDRLQQDLFNIYKGSPRSMGRAYNQAKKALKKNEEMTFSDDEIDSFLPKSLRKGKSR